MLLLVDTHMCDYHSRTGFKFIIKRIVPLRFPYFSYVTGCVACDWLVSILAGYLN